ncbi:hypothetical protein MHPYR_230029 [uncultured Mycobacterium sp.]|uniref:Uncharacterized protein n=1 Tax=uncultured Mycobacterium sp. TaxID=171292 RepID=A0A1Y5PDQ7_9MYCO|nr:hypothetical protein MHPYR_230029 [uncultured Mycobacterium sp.]
MRIESKSISRLSCGVPSRPTRLCGYLRIWHWQTTAGEGVGVLYRIFTERLGRPYRGREVWDRWIEVSTLTRGMST